MPVIGVMQMTDGRAKIVTIYIVTRFEPVKNNVPVIKITSLNLRLRYFGLSH